MDSLLASYASSDEEEEEEEASPPQQPQKHINQPSRKEDDFEYFLSNPQSKSPNFLLPPPKSSFSAPFSLASPNSLPPNPYKPKQQESDPEEDDNEVIREKLKPSSLFSSLPQPKPSPSLFSVLPPPKTHDPEPQAVPYPVPASSTSSKRVVQFRPPMNPVSMKSSNVDDEDESDDEEEKERRRKKAESAAQTSTVKSFLSSIPAPRNSATLGVLGSGLGTGRRSVIDADVPASYQGNESSEGEAGISGTEGQSTMSSMGGVSGSAEQVAGGDFSSWGTGSENYVNYDGYGVGESNADYSNWNAASGDYSSYGSDSGNYVAYRQYGNNWTDGSTTASAPEVPLESALRLPAKRGRNDAPPQIIEVNQEELMKNRPREDQVKLTGIAFGPSYQPASSKGKPTKLHKRKHQIGALYFDMKQKEMELAERRARGFLTKAQTQGKYGW